MKTIAIALLCILLFSCEKQEPTPPEPIRDGQVRFTCTSANPYNTYINNVFWVQISGNSFSEIKLGPGYYTYKLEQAAGYLFTPTIRTGSFTLKSDQQIKIVFP